MSQNGTKVINSLIDELVDKLVKLDVNWRKGKNSFRYDNITVSNPEYNLYCLKIDNISYLGNKNIEELYKHLRYKAIEKEEEFKIKKLNDTLGNLLGNK